MRSFCSLLLALSLAGKIFGQAPTTEPVTFEQVKAWLPTLNSSKPPEAPVAYRIEVMDAEMLLAFSPPEHWSMRVVGKSDRSPAFVSVDYSVLGYDYVGSRLITSTAASWDFQFVAAEAISTNLGVTGLGKNGKLGPIKVEIDLKKAIDGLKQETISTDRGIVTFLATSERGSVVAAVFDTSGKKPFHSLHVMAADTGATLCSITAEDPGKLTEKMDVFPSVDALRSKIDFEEFNGNAVTQPLVFAGLVTCSARLLFAGESQKAAVERIVPIVDWDAVHKRDALLSPLLREWYREYDLPPATQPTK